MDASDSTKQIVRVTIFNQTYAISAPGSSEQTEQLARDVDDLMSTIARRAGNLDTTRTAVLACLHLADQLRHLEQELETLQAAVREKTRDFSSVLDRAFQASVGD